MKNLKIQTLPTVKTWIDKDIIMLHACFQLLVDFVEKENGLTHCNYEHHKIFIDECRELYNWWLERRKKIYTNDIEDTKDQEMLERLVKIRQFLCT